MIQSICSWVDNSPELDGDSYIHKYVIPCLCLAVYVKLLDTERQSTSYSLERVENEVYTGVDQFLELTKILNYTNFFGSYTNDTSAAHITIFWKWTETLERAGD